MTWCTEGSAARQVLPLRHVLPLPGCAGLRLPRGEKSDDVFAQHLLQLLCRARRRLPSGEKSAETTAKLHWGKMRCTSFFLGCIHLGLQRWVLVPTDMGTMALVIVVRHFQGGAIRRRCCCRGVRARMHLSPARRSLTCLRVRPPGGGVVHVLPPLPNHCHYRCRRSVGRRRGSRARVACRRSQARVAGAGRGRWSRSQAGADASPSAFP